MKIDDFLKEEMNWSDRDLEYRPVIGYWKVAELLQKWGEKQLELHNVVGRSEQLCENLDKNLNCKNMCLTHCIDGNKFWK